MKEIVEYFEDLFEAKKYIYQGKKKTKTKSVIKFEARISS